MCIEHYASRSFSNYQLIFHVCNVFSILYLQGLKLCLGSQDVKDKLSSAELRVTDTVPDGQVKISYAKSSEDIKTRYLLCIFLYL